MVNKVMRLACKYGTIDTVLIKKYLGLKDFEVNLALGAAINLGLLKEVPSSTVPCPCDKCPLSKFCGYKPQVRVSAYFYELTTLGRKYCSKLKGVDHRG